MLHALLSLFTSELSSPSPSQNYLLLLWELLNFNDAKDSIRKQYSVEALKKKQKWVLMTERKKVLYQTPKKVYFPLPPPFFAPFKKVIDRV